MNEEDKADVDREFEQRARSGLRRELEVELPPELRERLDRGVDAALNASTRSFNSRLMLPAAAAVLIAGFFAVQQMRTPAAPPSPAADDLALLLGVDNLDLLEQMEFYQWLDRQPDMLEEALATPAGEAQRS